LLSAGEQQAAFAVHVHSPSSQHVQVHSHLASPHAQVQHFSSGSEVFPVCVMNSSISKNVDIWGEKNARASPTSTRVTATFGVRAAAASPGIGTAEASQKRLQPADRLDVHGIEPPPPYPANADQAGILQNPQMERQQRLANSGFICQLADTTLAADEPPENGQPFLVAQGVKASVHADGHFYCRLHGDQYINNY